MITPAVAGWRFLMGLILGCGLGLWYAFLRPFGQRHPHLADLFFVSGLFPVWIYHSFAVCQGDLSVWYLLSLALGAVLTDITLGRLLRPIFGWIWTPVWWFFSLFQKFFKKLWGFSKKIFAYMKKMSTIIMRKNGHKGGNRKCALRKKCSNSNSR